MIAQLVLTPILLAALAAQEHAERNAAQSQAQICVEATAKGDIAKVVDLTHPKVVAMGGGREKVISGTRQKRDALEKQGVSYVSGKADVPTTIYRTKTGLYCVVPVAYRVKAGETRLIMKSPLVGISTDSGKSWTFLDTSPGEATVRKLFPELPKDLKFPPDEELQVEP